MRDYTRACIAYIVGRLIAGKDVTAIYDYEEGREIDVSGLPDSRCLKEFANINWSYLSGGAGICRYQYSCSAGHHFHLSIKGNTFVGYIRNSPCHFMGKVKGDAVYLYDHQQSSHFNFRISGNAVSH